MRNAKPQPLRNKLDLSDHVQVRIVKKRLRLTDAQLIEIVGRAGNSLSAIGKEVALRAKSSEPQAPAALIVPVAEATVTDLGAGESAS